MPVAVERVHLDISLLLPAVAETAGFENMEYLGLVGISHIALTSVSVWLVIETGLPLFERVLVSHSIEFVVSVDGPVEDVTVAASREDLIVAVILVA